MNYKGMDKNMQCRGFQYEVGKEYETDKATVCECGFHACEHPLNTFKYYSPAQSRYFAVEQSGEIRNDSEDTKVASTKILIGAELNISDLVNAAIEYTLHNAKPDAVNLATGDCGVANSTGYYGAANSTGDYGAASSAGCGGVANSTGYHGAASSAGCGGVANSTNSCGAASSTGDYGAANSTGDYGAASSTGCGGVANSTGYYGAANSTGDCGAASSTGSCGVANSTGDYGVAIVTGSFGAASAVGDGGVALAAGFDCKAMGGVGCAIFLVERGYVDGKMHILNVAAEIVDGVNIKADTYYKLVNGEIVEV